MKVEDFFTRTNHETPVKLPLLLDGEDSGEYLMVLGCEARSVARDKINWGIAYAKAQEALKEATKDASTEDATEERIKVETAVYTPFANALVVDWSFGDMDKDKLAMLIDEHPGLAISIVNQSFAHSLESKKK
jgi:hypothetical protein